MKLAPFLVPLLGLVAASLFDFSKRQIPDAIPIMLVGWAVGATALGVASHGWLSFAGGVGLGMSVGTFSFWLGGFGGGDAKLLAAVGAAVGLREFLPFLVFTAIAGGFLAALALARGKRDLAYAPAMALGMLVLMIIRVFR